MSSVQWPHVVSSFGTGQRRYRICLPSQEVLLDSTVPESQKRAKDRHRKMSEGHVEVENGE